MTKQPTSPQQRIVLTIAILATFVAFLDGTVVNVALPAILDDFHGDISLQQWVVDAYLITLGALILVAGSVSDAYGRIRVIRIGLIGFGVTSLAIALAPTAQLLISARLLQGASGALLVPSSLALIMSYFRGAAQARAIGTWTGITASAMIIGPVVGGLCVDLASWRWAFAINLAPIAITLYLLTKLTDRDTRARDASGANAKVDLLSAALVVTGLGGVVYALIEQPNSGWGSPQIWLPAALGAAALAAFFYRQATFFRPMLPLSMFRARNFAWGNIATALIYGALQLVGFAVSVYLQEGAGLSATAAGLAQLPITLLMIGLSRQVGGLAGRFGPRIFMTMGPLAMAAGVLLMLNVGRDFNYSTQVLPGIVLFGLGLTAMVSPLTSATLGAVETARSGIASATNNAIARIAGLVVIATLGAIVGGELDLSGFHRAVIVSATLLAVGGIASWIGIRNPAADATSSP